jgi:hypothetical protein
MHKIKNVVILYKNIILYINLKSSYREYKNNSNRQNISEFLL